LKSNELQTNLKSASLRNDTRDDPLKQGYARRRRGGHTPV
jgi:hypothetical protein